MLKMIKPIVNISKIMDDYDTFVLGLSGVITDGLNIKQEVVSALINLKKNGKTIVLLTNSALRIGSIVNFLHSHNVPVALFSAAVSCGEIMHYKLKAKNKEIVGLGSNFYHIGSPSNLGVFQDLDYNRVSDISKADFVYVSGADDKDDYIDKYIPLLEHAANMSIPFLCVNNDISTFMEGKVSLAAGAIAEQYAVLGGKIITIGKPDINLLKYALSDVKDYDKDRTVLIGDNLRTDIKLANLADIHSILVSKGVHANFLGEGYIPDVAKTRELATNYESYPNYVVSNFRW